MSLDVLIHGLRTRREEATAEARSNYFEMVARLATDGPSRGDTAAAVAKILAAAGYDEARLEADVSRVQAHRRDAEQAARLPEIEADLAKAGEDEARARAVLEAEYARLRAVAVEAHERGVDLQRAAERSQEALERVVEGAHRRVAIAYEEAQADLAGIEGTIANLRRELAEFKAPPAPAAELVAAEWSALTAAQRALAEHDARNVGTTDEGAEHAAARLPLDAAVDVARAFYGAALLRVAEEAERSDVPKARAAVAEARAALLAAPLVIDPAGQDQDDDQADDDDDDQDGDE